MTNLDDNDYDNVNGDDDCNCMIVMMTSHYVYNVENDDDDDSGDDYRCIHMATTTRQLHDMQT